VNEVPGIDVIREAAERIRPFIHRTPVLTCRALDALSGARLFFKCENFQNVGAFKIRGATNAVFSLSDQEAAPGVATHSSGNHAAALAQAARWRGVQAYVVMPENAPAIKQAAVAGYGADITLCQPTLPARERGLAEVVARTGAAVVHPYDDARVIAGQGTAALELIEEVGGFDLLMAPVGGGGLVSGTALCAAALAPGARVIATEPAQADDAARSFRIGSLVEARQTHTIADGLRTGLSELTFGIICKYVYDIVTVGEDEIIAAMRLVWERMKIVIEPSSAVPVAALLSGRMRIAGCRIGVILSGGNVDLDHLPWRP